MPCLLGCLALAFPRVVIVLVWLFSQYLNVAMSRLWLLLGFLFMPFTTLAYAWAYHFGGGQISLGGVIVLVIAVLMDLGALGGGGHGMMRKREIA